MTSRMCRANSEKGKMRKLKAGKDSSVYSLCASAQVRPGTACVPDMLLWGEPLVERNSYLGLVHVSMCTGMGVTLRNAAEG